ncbi:adenylate/guanylate cyclase domain-containing protein [Streptomyces erythrochromogenes]|uniref:adenylate/guanylate cyclase domain-containing protein n=1 Tax=Streptomyces erythrochromogenes TaxID=285574 RepID=UPI00343EBB6C
MNLNDALVLVADDDPVSRTVLSKLVAREGHRVIEAKTGEEAWKVIKEASIDILLLDLEMPELDGYGVLQRLQESGKRYVPTIVISALEDIDSVVRAIDLGADDYIPKPINRTLLRARINASLSRKRLLDLEDRRIREIFAHFIPESLVEEVLATTDSSCMITGQRRIASVMFSDLRGFTTWAESSPPDRVIEVLNRYLSTMSDVILDHGGTLVSYMGDGIMAVFGAPVEDTSHADLAVAAAREMAVDALSDFNAWLRHHDLGQGFRVGIGVNSGPVMSGTVGSERRLEYTAVGDTTNTAARLEQLTKSCGHTVLVSEATRNLLSREPSDLAPIGEFSLRGKEAAVSLWILDSADRAREASPQRSTGTPTSDPYSVQEPS